jgi:NDP-sugar pyrophosphorylase family protein
MQAIILAGGKGTRLKPYTISFPKPLVPVGDYPVMEIVVRQLVKSGFQEIVVSTGHLAELIQAYFGDGSRWGVKIRYVREDKPLNTAGALKLIEGLASEFLVMNGDILSKIDYGALLKEHKDSGAMATIATTNLQHTVDFGVLDISEQGDLVGYREKPRYDFTVSTGVYVFRKDAVDRIKPGEALGMPDLYLRLMAEKQRVRCHRFSGYWLDIGRAEDYARAQEEYKDLI